ncbi:MurD [Desulforapulum autotrophicum HRM2]|uniref:UDP-N-acetylmuramoylalanine--D-glutamate ligase n=1 Tax=Desulforapulum autotrophicum (strain ATCC 43914 / DSM 3382 / VKM B-1955 / HRM2) TaxID=177437 RepID=C0Q8P1_DESAH|nr:UDP-N-acetylmuramoyl-L-alanine--D-glutamate ligase [Desulforapulum autotrophicum]ACN14381.1 MurD [Desulforapulum autotrophicum HRM2]
MTLSTVMASLLKHPDEGYVLVAGLGVSGVAIARFLRSKNIDVVATDSRPLGQDVTAPLEALGVRCETNGHRVETFEGAALVVTSPGIPLDMAFFERARAKKISVTGELDLFFYFLERPLVAITGTNGKTTVTTLVSEMLKRSGLSVFTGGNIGTPLVEFLESGQTEDVVVAEVSSFQLDAATMFAPRVAVLLNIAEDHMDRYTAFSAYADSKWALLGNQSENDIAVVNQTLPIDSDRKRTIKAVLLTFGEDKACNAAIDTRSIAISTQDQKFVLDLSVTRLRGAHNRENIAAAALAALLAGACQAGIQGALDDFSGLAHRTEYVTAINGVDYYNDSKGTNPHAVEGALRGFDRVILILGGRSKGTDFSCLVPLINQRVKTVILMGEAAREIKAVLGSTVEILEAGSMADVVSVANRIATHGDTVLLSPGCSSFDMYDNYAQRGRDFKDQVMKLKGNTP